MATYTLTISADVSKYIAGLKAIPGATAAQAEKAAIALASANAKSGKSAEEALAHVNAYAAALVKQGASEKTAASEALKYAQAMARESEAAQKVTQATTAATTQATAAVTKGATANQQFAVSAGASKAAIGQVGMQLSDVASQLSTGTNPFTILIQQGPQLKQAFDMGGGAVKVMGGFIGSLAGPTGLVVAALGELAVVGTALYGIYNSYNEVAKTQELVTIDQNAAFERLNSLMSDTRDTEIDLLVATGKLTKEQGELQKAAITAFEQYNAAIEETRAKLSKLQQDQASVSTQMVDNAESWIPAWTPLGMAVRGLTSDTADYQQQIDGQVQSMQIAGIELGKNKEKHEKLTQAEIDEAAAKDRQKAARKDHTKATREEEEALRRLNAAMQAENDAAERSQKVYQGALDSLAQIEGAQRQSLMTDAEKVESAHTALLAQIEADRQRALSATTTITGVETAEQSARDASLAANAAYVQQLRDLDTKRTEDARKQAEERAKIEQQTNQAKYQLASAGAGALISLTQTVSQNMSDEQKKGSMALFIAQKAGAVAQAGINTALAVSNALATPAPPPIPQILAGAALVTGGAAAIQIASAPPPKFHTGTLGSNEYPATYQKGEAVIPASSMAKPGAREQAAALVAGKSATDEEAFARGMDKSATPAILSEILRVLSRQKPQQQPPARPGHRGKYAY